MIFAGTMNFMDAVAVKRLEGFFERVGEILGNDERRASFATYAMGILSDAEKEERGAARGAGVRVSPASGC